MTSRRDPVQAAEIMRDAGYEPLEPYQSLKHKWRCTHRNCGREVTPTLGQILRGQGGCKFCARVYVDPAAAVEVMRHAGYEPLEPYVNSSHRWRCRCVQCGRETFPRYDEARIGSRCVYCARKKLDPTDAVKLMKDAGFEPLEAYPGLMDPWECRHSCGRIVRPRYAHIQQGRRGCEYCSRQSMADQFRWTDDEAYAFIEELGYTPIVPYPGRNNAPWLMKHRECGREVTPRLAGLQQGQGGCKPCHQDRLAERYQTPEDVAESRLRAAGFEPLEPYPGKNHTPWRAKHTCGKVSSPALANLQSGSSCVWCAEKRVDPLEAEAFWREQGLEPLEPYGASHRPWLSRHLACGREVSPTWNSVRGGSGPCKFCADHGFDRSAPGILYLIRHLSLAAIKIGVTTEAARNSRLAAHAKNGWELLDLRRTATGDIAEILESAVLSWWRNDLKLPLGATRFDMPQSGFTETAPFSEVDIPLLWQRVDALHSELESPA